MPGLDILLKELSSYFIPPKKTRAGLPFGGWDAPQTSFEDAKVVVYGVPFEGTATYGNDKASSVYGPWAIRKTSGEQIETYVIDVNYDPYSDVGVFDLGDYKLPPVHHDDRKLIYDPPLKSATKKEITEAKKRVHKVVAKLKELQYVTQTLRNADKVPLMLGGEHLISLWPLNCVGREKPVVLHFDAHMDMKEEYLGVRYSHTTPMYYALFHDGSRFYEPVKGNDFIQIGIRQGSRDELENARKAGVVVYFYEALHKPETFDMIKNDIFKHTKQRKVYITFDIDALDSCYTPFTGTPEPSGMTPYQAYELIDAISPDAKIIGMDMMEVSSDGVNTIEGTVATELILRMLAHPSLRK